MSIESPEQRWRVVVPQDALVVETAGEAGERAAVVLRGLPPSTRVALIGGRGVARIAHRYGITVEREFVVMPSLRRPVAITQVAPESLRWFVRSILTVPPGRSRFHAIIWGAVKVIRWRPRVLVGAPVGDRIVIGVRE